MYCYKLFYVFFCFVILLLAYYNLLFFISFHNVYIKNIYFIPSFSSVFNLFALVARMSRLLGHSLTKVLTKKMYFWENSPLPRCISLASLFLTRCSLICDTVIVCLYLLNYVTHRFTQHFHHSHA